MKIDDLYDIEFEANSNPILYQSIKLLKEAVTDWPTNIETIDQFLQEIKEHLNCPEITLELVDRAVKDINLSEAWQIESLTSVQQIMKISKQDTLERTLKELLDNISRFI